MVAANAYKGGHRRKMRALYKELNRELAEMRAFNQRAAGAAA